MGLFRPDRGRRDGEDRFFVLKQVLFVTGAILAMVGIARENGTLIFAAIAALTVGTALRFFR